MRIYTSQIEWDRRVARNCLAVGRTPLGMSWANLPVLFAELDAVEANEALRLGFISLTWAEQLTWIPFPEEELMVLRVEAKLSR